MSHKTDAAITEILNMPAGKGMDELILEKIFGYEKLPPPACPKFQKPTDDGVVKMLFIPPYSTTISAAWLVVEKMAEGADFFEGINGDWKTFMDGLRGNYLFVLDAEKAARLICCAALLTTIKE